jgi:hypothetical protein
MRKVLSFVLVLSLVLGSFSMAFAAPLSDVAGEDFEDAVNVLTELGVVSGYPDGTYKPDNIVTRAEMAVIVVRALGLADYANGTAKFSDMAGHWSNPYVAYATSLGVIAGYPDGTFKPDATVTYDEAATMLVAALGYTPDSLVGTWPANYVTKAKTLGILDGIKGGAVGANRGDIATMTFQTLDQNIGKTDKDGVWEPTVLKKGATAADDEYDLMLGRLGAEKARSGNKFVLTDSDADNAIANVRDYVGAYVTAYTSDGDIIAVVEKSTFLTGEMVNGKFEVGSTKYTIAGADFMGGALNFENGEFNGTTSSSITTDDGVVTLAAKVSGVTIQEVYSVSKWINPVTGQFEDGDADDIAEDGELFGEDFVKDVNDTIDTASFVLLGANKLSDIDEDNIVYVYVGESGKIRKVEVGTEVVSGEVTRVEGTAKAENQKFTIGGTKYSLAYDDQDAGTIPVPKDEVTAYLNYAGKIYVFDDVEGGAVSNYALLLDVENADGSGKFATTGKVYLFLADGSDKVFEVKDEFKVDASTTRSATNLSTLATNGALVSYKVDSKGKVSEIIEIGNGHAGTDLTSKGYYNGYAVDSNAVIFVGAAKGASDDPDDYSVTTLAKMLGKEGVESFAYALKSNKIVAMFINDDATDTDAVYGVVTAHAANSSTAGNEVDMLVGKEAKTYNTEVESVDKFTLYEITFTVAGDAKLTPYSGSIEKTTMVSIVASEGALELSGRVVTVASTGAISASTPGSIRTSGGAFTFDSDVVIYVKDGASKLKATGSLRDIVRHTGTIEFYDVYDNDLVYDFVILK